MRDKKECPQPVGYYTEKGGKDQNVRYPVQCNSWTCPVCGPRKLRRFLYSLGYASFNMIKGGYRFRGLTLTLGQEARNVDLGKYWHRFRMSLKKAGYLFEYLWVKEFQKNGKLHLHALITAFIPWNVIKYYWRLATKDTSYIVWIAQAQVQSTAAYISKYITKDLLDAPFRKGERRYGMSKGMRLAWPKIESMVNGVEKKRYEFTYKPDNSNPLKTARNDLTERINHRKAWQSETPLRDHGVKRYRSHRRPRYRPTFSKSNLILEKYHKLER